MVYDIILRAIMSGVFTLLNYMSAHVLLCLIPAFFLSGAFNALIPTETILKFMGNSVSRLQKAVAYIFAATSGLVLEVCSCTILPLFAGIWKKGAGFGPAITFLFAGPGITLLSTPLTAAVLGVEFAVTKLIFSIIIAIAIGVVMELMFKREVSVVPEKNDKKISLEKRGKLKPLLFFSSLILIMVFGTAPIDIFLKIVLVALASIFTAFFSKYYKRSERVSWLKETWNFFKMIFPILLVGVFISGVLKEFIPQELVATYTGQNTITANLIAVLFGTIAYFPTLVEVPIAQMFMELGMSKGPMMAYLIADPAVSIQTLLVVSKIIKPKKTMVYALLIIIFSVITGFIYGMM
jgi:hypothetical protein